MQRLKTATKDLASAFHGLLGLWTLIGERIKPNEQVGIYFQSPLNPNFVLRFFFPEQKRERGFECLFPFPDEEEVDYANGNGYCNC